MIFVYETAVNADRLIRKQQTVITQKQHTDVVQSQVTQSADSHTKPAEQTAVAAKQAAESYDKSFFEKEIEQYSDVILPHSGEQSSFDNVVFIGDSNTEGLSAYGYLPQSNVFGKRSMAVGQVLTERFVDFGGDGDLLTAIEAAEKTQPQIIVLNFGTNNAAGSSVESFTAQYSQVITQLRNACPHSEIAVAAVLPVGYYRENTAIKQQAIDSFNLALAQLCRSMGCSFLNYCEVFKAENGYMDKDYVATDGIHLDSSGYSLLLEYAACHLPCRSESTNADNIADISQSIGNMIDEKIIYDPF